MERYGSFEHINKSSNSKGPTGLVQQAYGCFPAEIMAKLQFKYLRSSNFTINCQGDEKADSSSSAFDDGLEDRLDNLWYNTAGTLGTDNTTWYNKETGNYEVRP